MKRATTGKLSRPSPALVGRARKLADEKRARQIAAGRAALARILERKADIAGAYWDIGDDLLVLAEPGVAKALGFQDHYTLCWQEAELSAELVDQLVTIRQRLSREEAIRLKTRTKAAAYLRLAEATPADDTAVELFERGLTVPGGKPLAPDASTRAVNEAAKRVRHAHQPRARRGRTTTPEERALGDRLRRALAKERAGAKVEVLATRPGHPSKLRIEIAVTELAALERALRAAKVHQR